MSETTGGTNAGSSGGAAGGAADGGAVAGNAGAVAAGTAGASGGVGGAANGEGAAAAGATLLTTPAADPAAATTDPAKPAETAKPEGAPEKYEFTPPEGVTFDPAAIEAFTPVAKELNLTNAQAQSLVELHAKQMQAAAASNAAAFKAVSDGWVQSARADAEFGGLKFAQSVGLATKALDAFGTPELRRALDDTGMGNHPELIRLLTRVGRAVGEDNLVTGNAGNAGAKKSVEQILFPNFK